MLSTLLYGMLALAASSVDARAVPEQSLARRHAFGTTGQCAPQPAGSGPVTNNPDTADAFVANPVYGAAALSAVTPAGWSVAYQNLSAASTTGGYLSVQEITSYNTSYCAAQCCSFWPNCTSFNIYYERDPTVDPGDNCTNPASTTRIKCSFWSQNLTPSDATNNGQYCAGFHVVIAGSNGYNAGSACPTTTSTSTAPTSTPTTPSTTTPALGTKITACPYPETTYTAADGSTWAICKGTDYQGTTTQNVYNIYDSNSCGAACDSVSGCTKAIFHSKYSVCYIKGSPLTWVVNPVYDAIRQITGPTPTPTPSSSSNWNTWTQPQPKKTCFLWLCW